MDYSGIASPFTAVVDTDGVIYSVGLGRERRAVGIDSQRERELLDQMAEMKSVLDNYYDKLVNLGEIEPQKTAEEIAIESANEQVKIARAQAENQVKVNQEILNAMEKMKSELDSLKKDIAKSKAVVSKTENTTKKAVKSDD